MKENENNKIDELGEEKTPAQETEDNSADDSQAKEEAASEEDTVTEEAPKDEEATEEEASSEETERNPLEVANEKIAELNDKYLRKVAEFDNFRKRTLKEKAELILNGGQKAITKILPVIDDIERAIENGKKTDDVDTLREGMDLIYKKFMKILEGEGVERIATEDQDFNTDFHEAIAMVPGMGDDKKGKIIDCVQTGYTLNGKVIRYAKVAVGQ